MRRAAWRAVAAAVALVPAASPAPAGGYRLALVAADPAGGYDASLSPDGRRVAVSSTRSGTSSIWLFDRESRDWRQLTDDQGDDSEPAWSPDGTEIAFTSWRGDEKNIWTVDVASGAVSRVTSGPQEEEYPAFGPSGDRIVYTGGDWKARNFFEIPREGGEARPILAAPGHVGACTYHPGGASLLCHVYDRGLGDVVEIDLGTSAATRLTAGDRWYYKPTARPGTDEVALSIIDDEDIVYLARHEAGSGRLDRLRKVAEGRWPVFSASGDELLFHRIVEQGSELRLLDRETGAFETLAGEADAPASASLSADGALVAYCSRREGEKAAIVVIDRARGRSERLSFGGREACHPALSPDGSRLAFTLRAGARWEVALAPLDRPDEAEILTGDVAGIYNMDQPLDWSPDGTRIAFSATTAPYEADIFVIDAGTGRVSKLTDDAAFDEAPSFGPDGKSVAFMSTRGGAWTWGLYSVALSSGAVTPLSDANYVEKTSPVELPSGALAWIETNSCLSTTYLAERHGDGPVEYLLDHPGAKWARWSRDGRRVLFTIASRRTEYWIARLAR